MRTFLLVAFLGLGGYAFYAWATSGPEADSANTRRDGQKDKPPPNRVDGAIPEGNPGGAGAIDPPRGAGDVNIIGHDAGNHLGTALVIGDAIVKISDGQEVSSQRQGQILYLGREPRPGEKVDPKKAIPVRISFLAVETTEEDLKALGAQGYRVKSEAKLFRKYRDEDVLEGGKLRILTEEKTFVKVEEGTRVKKDDVLGLIDPQLAVADLNIRIAKLKASEADLKATEATAKEAERRYQALLEAERRAPGSVSKEELFGAALTAVRYVQEGYSKDAARVVAQRELTQSDKLVKQHEIKATIDGVVKMLYKHAGEAVREQEQILQIQNTDILKIEGFISEQDAGKLSEGMAVIVEPNQSEAPDSILRGHRGPVNAVAVGKGNPPLVVTGGDDRTARVRRVSRAKNGATNREEWHGRELFTLEHPAAVRAVACTGPKSPRNLCVTGAADGVGRIWNLDDPKSGRIDLTSAHRGAITAAAFSADGAWCATGGEDHDICLWDTATGELKHRVSGAHRGAISSLVFTGKGHLASVGRDYAMNVWVLKGNTPRTIHSFDRRGGHVDQLGVHPSGDFLLYDQGRSLRILRVTTGGEEAVLTHPSGSVNFSTFALFSPDGKMILTAGGAEGRLQLWRNPQNTRFHRASELRQYAGADVATAAAFAPDAPLIVSGTRDSQVLLWSTPDIDEIPEPQANATLRYISEFVESDSRQRLVVEVWKKTKGLKPGTTATIVVQPADKP